MKKIIDGTIGRIQDGEVGFTKDADTWHKDIIIRGGERPFKDAECRNVGDKI